MYYNDKVLLSKFHKISRSVVKRQCLKMYYLYLHLILNNWIVRKNHLYTRYLIPFVRKSKNVLYIHKTLVYIFSDAAVGNKLRISFGGSILFLPNSLQFILYINGTFYPQIGTVAENIRQSLFIPPFTWKGLWAAGCRVW